VAVVLSTLLRSGIVFRAGHFRSPSERPATSSSRCVRRCEVAVSAGEDIGDALERTAAFPPMVVQIFALGQQSGRLEEMLDRLATAYQQQVSSAAQRFTAVLSPR